MMINRHPHPARPDDLAVGAVIRELAAVSGLRSNHPRRLAALASKRRLLAEIEAYEASLTGAPSP